MDRFTRWKLSVTSLLFAGLLIFSTAVFVCAIWLPTDERLFAFLSGIAGNFSGALFTWVQVTRRRIEGDKDKDKDHE